MISAKSLRIDYDDLTAVSDLNLEIPSGQIYGLVGPNGAGKTSTIKALAGIIEPTYGEIKINGIDLELYQDKALQQLGYMPDFAPVYENLKTWEYLDAFAAAYLMTPEKRRQKTEEWLSKVNLLEKRNTLIRELSRGMRQRLVLAKTLIHDPQVLLLDEPASGLDPVARREMRDVLKAVAAQKKTIIISSHILTELSDFCNAIGIMERGQMVISGTIDYIRARMGSKGKLIVRLSKGFPEVIEKLMSILKTSDLVSNIEPSGSGQYQCEFSGNAQDMNDLLEKLIKLQVPIAQFYLQESTVEDIFFKIGAQRVS
jgi:ABC-2 type transport system ATP-binding protein